jgi:prepilin-type processing-associated H-X9-DG protein
MNNHMRGNFPSDPATEEWHYQNLGNLVGVLPLEGGFVFIDTHEDSIATGEFWVSPRVYWASAWGQFPASRHNGSATLSFSDGHVVSHKWIDSRTRQPVTGKSLYGERQDDNPDIVWLQNRATVYRRSPQ